MRYLVLYEYNNKNARRTKHKNLYAFLSSPIKSHVTPPAIKFCLILSPD